MNDLERKVFNHYIEGEISLYNCMHAPDRYIESIGEVSKELGITKYQAAKVVHSLCNEGLLERTSLGCPAEVAYYGEGEPELIDDAHPPLNGFSLTKKALETEEYKRADKEYIEELDRWMSEMEEKSENELRRKERKNGK